MSRKNPVVFVVGPTATGKSALALQLAEKFGGVILNGDSLQTYQRLDIGTAKPSQDERAKIPHFLFDVVPPGQELTAGDYRRLALEVLREQIPHHPVFVVGGSGFYLQALEKGMFPVTKPDPELDAEVRRDLEKLGAAALHTELERLDPETADRINPNDAYRIIRAVVILRQTGRKVSEVKGSFKPEPLPYPVLKLGLNLEREALLAKVKRRTRAMLQAGLVAEVKRLFDEGFENWPPIRSIGYWQCVQFLKGELSEERLAEQIDEKTMQLAKKQRTWFKRDPEIHWLEPQTAFVSACAILPPFLDTLS